MPRRQALGCVCHCLCVLWGRLLFHQEHLRALRKGSLVLAGGAPRRQLTGPRRASIPMSHSHFASHASEDASSPTQRRPSVSNAARAFSASESTRTALRAPRCVRGPGLHTHASSLQRLRAHRARYPRLMKPPHAVSACPVCIRAARVRACALTVRLASTRCNAEH